MELVYDMFPPGRDRTEASLRFKMHRLKESLSPGVLKKLDATMREFLARGETIFLEECQLSSTESGDAIVRWPKDCVECHISNDRVVLKRPLNLLWHGNDVDTFLSILHEVPNCRYRWVRRYTLSHTTMESLTSGAGIKLSDNFELYEIDSVVHLGVQFTVSTASIIIIKCLHPSSQSTCKNEQFSYKGHRLRVNNVDKFSSLHLEKYGGQSNL